MKGEDPMDRFCICTFHGSIDKVITFIVIGGEIKCHAGYDGVWI